MQQQGLDTSPKILENGKEWYRGNLVNSSSQSATIIYSYESSNSVQNIITAHVYGVINVFRDGTYIDYWSPGNYKLNANSNGVGVNIATNEIDDAYLYITQTGVILFAGKNTIYYGHRNISELN